MLNTREALIEILRIDATRKVEVGGVLTFGRLPQLKKHLSAPPANFKILKSDFVQTVPRRFKRYRSICACWIKHWMFFWPALKQEKIPGMK